MLDLVPILLVLVGSVIAALGSLYFKKSADKFLLRNIWKSGLLWLGIFLHLFSMIMYVVALRFGELTLLYPLVSTTYIWVVLFSVKSLGEKMNKWKWISLVGIVLGVVLVGIGG